MVLGSKGKAYSVLQPQHLHTPQQTVGVSGPPKPHQSWIMGDLKDMMGNIWMLELFVYGST